MTGEDVVDSGKTSLSEKVETIAINDVTYAVDELQILQGVTATFEAGKNYLISGESGSG